MRRRLILAVCSAVAGLMLASCGGGGSNFVAPPPPPPPPPPALTITTNSLPNVIEGQAYSFTFQASGGTGALTWTVINGLPTGLTLSPDGTLTGTVTTTTGNHFFWVQVQDSANPPQIATATESLFVVGILTLSNVSFPNGNRGISYQSDFFPTGGTGPFTLSVTAGTLPPGLNLPPVPDTRCSIFGTPTQAGTFPFTLQISDSGTGSLHQTATAQVTMTIDAKLQITTTSLPSGVQNRSYTGTMTAVNGTGALHWSASFIPSGLTLNSSTGVLSGTPTQSLSSGLSFTVTDSSSPPQSNSAFVQLVIYGTLQFTGTNLGSTPVGSFGVFSIPYTGGWPPVTSTLVSGTLPPGMGLNFAGNYLSGTPSQIGNYSFVVRLQDSASPPQTAQSTLTATITPIPPVLANSSLPDGVVGKPYSWGVAARNGQPPFAWSVSAGSLPPGLSLDSLGLIHGTPTTAGTYNFTLLVSDSFAPPDTTQANATITVHATPLGRNDSIAKATPLTNGTYAASISPYSDPSTTGPDTDYYKLTANPGVTVSLTIYAARLFPPSSLDSVIEIVDGAGTRLMTCKDPASAFLGPPLVPDPNPNDYNDACINDDDPYTGTLDSSLSFQVPGTPGGPPVTFFVHVLDWRGDARPDLVYQIQISGAN